MVTHKFPSTKFKKINVTKKEQLMDCFAYLIYVKFTNIESKHYNNFISQSKCERILSGKYDNGRVISAKELEIVLTDIDFKFIFNTHTFDSYEIKECYFSVYDYLPKEYIEFILQKYENKTKYKGVKGKELEYAIEKGKFNSLYGMTVTNNISDKVTYDNEFGWNEEKLNNGEIESLLEKEEKQAFLSFSYGVWVTAWARFNLLSNLIKYDNFVVYADTESLKLESNFDKTIIYNYNISVEEKIKKVSDKLKIPFEKFKPKDYKGIEHLLGVFEEDGMYDEFITQGAKKYAYKENGEIHITVSGVPKNGAKALKKLEDFKDNFIFKYEDTGKNMLMYNDNQESFELEDYQGNKEIIKDKYGVSLVPTTYELGKSLEYAHLISDDSSSRAIYKEG